MSEGDPTDPRYVADGKADPSVWLREVHITFYRGGLSALEKEEANGPAINLLRVIKNAIANPVALKTQQHLFKVARYGNKLSPRGSARTAENMLGFDGIIIDVDHTSIALTTTLELFACLDIAVLAYETVSSTPVNPRYRLVFILSRFYPPDMYEVLVAGADALAGGIGALESYLRHQFFFVGALIGGHVPAVAIVEGSAIDLWPGIEALGRAHLARRKPHDDNLPPPDPADAGIVLSREIQDTLLDRAFAGLVRLQKGHKRDGLLRTLAFLGRFRAHLTAFVDGEIIDRAWDQIAMCEPPPESEEIGRNAAEAGLRYGMQRPISIRAVLQRLNVGEEAARNGFAGVDLDGTPKPPGATDRVFLNPWTPATATGLPTGILASWMDEGVRSVAERDGLCPSSFAMALLGATCGCVNKNARFFPYSVLRFGLPGKQIAPENYFQGEAESMWSVPLVVWIMTIAPSGFRKTRSGDLAFRVLRDQRTAAWAKHNKEKDAYNRENPQQRAFLLKPADPVFYLLEDVTPEKVQQALARTNAGGILYADELALFLAFNRYGAQRTQQHNGAREYFIETYEGSSRGAGRISRDDFTKCNSLAVYGHIQPAKLAEFRDLDTDGLLQRFNMTVPTEVAPGRPDLAVTGIAEIEARMHRLLTHAPINYATEHDGALIVQAMERYAKELGTHVTEFGLGWEGATNKLHGTLCRYAALLHVLDDPTQPIIKTSTLTRADRLVREFLLPQMLHFYSEGMHTMQQKAIRIAEWILTCDKPRFTHRDVKREIWSCRTMVTKELGELLDLIASWGWIDPASTFPSNREFMVHPGLRMHFAAQREDARRRHLKSQNLQNAIRSNGR